MSALDAFHVKQAIFESLHTEEFAVFAKGFSSSLRGEALEAGRALPGYAETGNELTKREVRVLNLGETFYVSPLMSQLVTAAAESWPEDEPVEVEDWPTYHGFMYIPGGVSIIDIRGTVNTTVAFSWEVHGDTTYVTWWTDKNYDPPFYKDQPHWPFVPQYTPWHITILKHGKPLPTALTAGTVIPPEIGRQMRWVNNPNGEAALYFPMGWTPEQLAPEIGVDRVTAWLVSALRIMQQPLAEVEHKGLPAHVRKNFMRHKIRVKNTLVTVIDFRKRKSDFQHTGEREYSHRFFRRAHWRRQPYKRDDGTWDRRRIYIHSTIVGDPSKPLILRQHVNALTR